MTVQINIVSFLIFLSRFGTFLELHFLKQSVQTAPHNGLPAKACNIHKILSLCLKNKIFVNEPVSAIRMTSPCVIVYTQDSQNA